MDYGGYDKRTTKKDLRRKRVMRVYKRGGQYRINNVDSSKKKVNKNED